ncbi:hypothetical protein [Methanosarcina acetivorans]|nr:hypothetical protein [Methanosarcina acetivorans]
MGIGRKIGFKMRIGSKIDSKIDSKISLKRIISQKENWLKRIESI